ncbi:MAG TPA: GNAT family N-acetyltransferase [Chthoniobacterales bacterium]
MKVYQFDPITDPRWAELVNWHPKASVFHTVGWLRALQRTYDYGPIAFTTSPPDSALKNGLVFCSIDSWLTGRRIVSLPFSDHCEPLWDSAEDANLLIQYLQSAAIKQKWKYLELRPINAHFDQTKPNSPFLAAASYYLHRLNLSPNLESLFQGFDKDSVQRRVQRAERAGLVERCGRSDDLLEKFYSLFIITRRRHHLPPIPFAWFQNLIQCQDNALDIRLAYKDGNPIAAILTLRFKDVVYYKYGCSDTRFNRFGAMPWLLWRAMERGKLDGAKEFDMGRTQKDNLGLLAFKNHWVPNPERLVYWKFPESSATDSMDRWKLQVAKRIFSYMPDKLLTITGRLIYRHIG